ncbi:MAG: putative metal-binding motif-containing protein [Alphaproteobacteria bacterium]|nr:putative metal-binding motif-containing protein [Alphaproteobacteria bacterium]
MRTLLMLTALMVACGDKDVNIDETGSIPADDTGGNDTQSVDADGDGVNADEDCDDDNPDAFPGNTEVCDDVDNDCNGAVDDDAADAGTYYPDLDGDGYGDETNGTRACAAPSGYITLGADCDDSDAAINPDGTEVCDPNGADEDCDGLVNDADDSVSPDGYSTWHPDDDGDGYGDPSVQVASCDAPGGYVDNAEDCDDTDANANPDAGCGSSSDAWNGTYNGTVDLAVVVTNLGNLSDNCVGTATIVVDDAASYQIDGTATCSFQGLIATYIGTQTADIEGQFTGESSASGDVSVGTIITQTFTGTFSGDADFDGGFSGSTTYQGFNLNYTGQFETTRQ